MRKGGIFSLVVFSFFMISILFVFAYLVNVKITGNVILSSSISSYSIVAGVVFLFLVIAFFMSRLSQRKYS